MKTKFLLLGILLLVTTMLKAQEIATARINQNSATEFSKITVIYGNGESEIIQMEGWKALSIASLYEATAKNQKTITEFLKNISAKGYTITSSTGDAFMFFIIFTKK
jgi:hypothetical protein